MAINIKVTLTPGPLVHGTNFKTTGYAATGHFLFHIV